jgi:uncharacterized phage-associated protein
MYNALTIADEFLRIAKKSGKELTPLQLMKLVYIAHGWSFPVRRCDLFTNRIEAWKYGPVVPDLYHATKKFGRNPIPLSVVGDPDTTNVNSDTRQYLENVFAQYGHLSGIALSNLTHMTGTPWQITFEDGVFGKEIPDHLIQQHYEKLYRERQPSSAS